MVGIDLSSCCVAYGTNLSRTGPLIYGISGQKLCWTKKSFLQKIDPKHNLNKKKYTAKHFSGKNKSKIMKNRHARDWNKFTQLNRYSSLYPIWSDLLREEEASFLLKIGTFLQKGVSFLGFFIKNIWSPEVLGKLLVIFIRFNVQVKWKILKLRGN